MTLHPIKNNESHHLLSPLLLERGVDAFSNCTNLDGVRCNGGQRNLTRIITT